MANNIVNYILSVDSEGAITGLKKVGSESKKAKDGLDKARDSGKKAGVDFKAAFSKIGIAAAAGTAAIAAMTAATIATVKSIKSFTVAAVDMINDLGDIGNRSGVAADTIGALKAAFHASGQDASQVHQVLDVVAKKLGSLSRGSKAAEDAFSKYGIATHDLNGDLRSNNDILRDSMHVIQDLTDTSKRSRAAVELFGVGGQRLSQALGAGNFDKFLEFVNEFGAVAGPRAAKAAALFQDSVSLKNVAFEGFREELVLSLGLMEKFAAGLRALMMFFSGLKKVIIINKDAINEFATFSIESINNLLKMTIDFISLGVVPMGQGLQGLVEGSLLFGAAISRHVIKVLFLAIAALQKYAFVSDLVFGTKLVKSVETGLQSLIDLHNQLDPSTDQGMRNFTAFQEGAAKSMKLFSDITTTATKKTKGFSDGLNGLGDGLDDNAEKIDHLSESLKVIDKLLSKAGLPSGLTFGGIEDARSQVDTLIRGLGELGASKKLPTIQLPQGALDLSTAAKGASSSLLPIAAQIAIATALVPGIVLVASKIGALGDTANEINDKIEKSNRDRAKNIEQGLQFLPEVLVKTLPKVLVIFADAIIFGLAKAIAEIVNGLINVLNRLFTRQGRQEARAARREGAQGRFDEFMNRLSTLGDIAFEGSRSRKDQENIFTKGADRIISIFQRIGAFGSSVFEGMRSGGRIPSARSGLNFTGNNAGLHLLHKNEFVVPESGQAPQSVQRAMSGMGGSVNIVINSQVVEQNAIDHLVRQIEKRFSTFGQSTSPLFR